ncbi:MAG: fused MFS/spermidine synthase [Candidatus Obscuribacterales bacterium]|nr:fused MFS/spermidine synthase [Candidatus Obscuribacterales bacterium]
MNRMPALILFCLIVFLAAFLLFQIEPLIGKIVTLHYGGTASVWTICILFFQAVVLAGYFLTFLLSKLNPKLQILAYSILAVVSIGWSTIPLGPQWDCTNVIEPVSGLLYSLTVHLAVPCIVLATISGMMQVWFNLHKLGNPYPLYSVSNVGSIGALLAYPLLIEPAWTISKTLSVWSSLYLVLIALLTIAAILTGIKAVKQPNITISSSSGSRTSVLSFCWWVALNALGSVALLAYTSHITGDIAPMPLIWVLPLSLYLLTFVLVFSNFHVYKRVPFIIAWVILILIEPVFTKDQLLLGLVINLILVFVTCMICHGELAGSKPEAAKLPTFYLALALGGAIGGVFVGIIAPMIFSFEAERLVVIYVMAVALLYHYSVAKFITMNNKPMTAISITLIVSGTLIVFGSFKSKNLIHWERNFYGSARVLREGEMFTFCSGRINHGQQYVDPAKADLPAGAYQMPIKLIFDSLRKDNPNIKLNCGGVGMGVAVLAAFGHEGDRFTFYELDPKVERIARTYFSYLARTPAKTIVQIGDGRDLLNKQSPQNYDMLLVDAFNGDAIPCHLVTEEALQIYLKHLKQDGLLAFHISNSYVDLRPVLGNLAEALKLHTCTIRFAGGITYVVICRDIAPIDKLSIQFRQNDKSYPAIAVNNTPTNPRLPLWTDDYTNLASILKLR